MRVYQHVIAIVVSTAMAAVGGEVWDGIRKTKHGKKTKPPTMNPTTAPSPGPRGGCMINKFYVYIKNNLDVPLYAKKGSPSEGELHAPGCNACSDACDYSSCWQVPPGGTNYIYATKNGSPCEGVMGEFTYGPSDPAYMTQTGLQDIVLSYGDGGGPNGDVWHTQQFNYATSTGYIFGQSDPTSTSCDSAKDCTIYMAVNIAASPPTPAPASIQVYEGSWQLVSTDTTVSLTAGTSWSDSESSTIGKSFTDGFTEGVDSKFGTTKVSAGASQTMQSTSTTTISDTKSGNFGVSCTTTPCTGRLYQWQQEAFYNNSAPAQIVRSCFFTCVPNSTPKDPQCPLQFCETGGCQCCNAVWMLDSNSTTANHLAPSAGGNCTAKCGPNGVACTDNDECCTGSCDSGGSFVGGTCL